jgi:hypothetical protein
MDVAIAYFKALTFIFYGGTAVNHRIPARITCSVGYQSNQGHLRKEQE